MFPEVLIGHSFGAKCVLSIAEQFSRRTARLPRPVKVWALDALPGEVRSGEMGAQDRPADLITTLQHLPLPLPSRHWLVQRLEAAGFSTAVAAWAATNLAPLPGGGGLGWSFDLAGIADMYRSYEATDLWAFLERPAEGIQINFVRAERSSFRWAAGDEARIRALGHAVHLLRGSGHWVHTGARLRPWWGVSKQSLAGGCNRVAPPAPPLPPAPQTTQLGCSRSWRPRLARRPTCTCSAALPPRATLCRRAARARCSDANRFAKTRLINRRSCAPRKRCKQINVAARWAPATAWTAMPAHVCRGP